MAEPKTKPSDESVEAFLSAVTDEKRRADCLAVLELMKDVTKTAPKMWGRDKVGFGSYRYQYPTGREGEWFLTGFSPRKQNLTVYVLPGLGWFGDLLAKLGKHKTGQSCLYIKQLEDIDMAVLSELLTRSVANLASQRTDQ